MLREFDNSIDNGNIARALPREFFAFFILNILACRYFLKVSHAGKTSQERDTFTAGIDGVVKSER
jgi:hypothetical protein